ncbi:MAG: lysoplasmalogenase [Chloroflexi bacterium]|nr:lysoplasmalogenase [Chloroflexota bacterium]
MSLSFFSMEHLWLLVLLLLWAALLFGGFIFGRPHEDGKRRMPTWTRMASSLALVLAGWGGFLSIREGDAGAAALLVALGMTLGFLGDLFMARLIPVGNHILGGIGAFGLGHILYIMAFVQFDALAGTIMGANAAALVIWWLIGVGGWYLIVFRGQKPTPLHLAALPYALLLSSTAGFATMLAVAQPPIFVPLAVGAALFLLSDLILAAELFNGLHFPLIGDVVWLTYGPAQMLIVYSMIGALLMWK